MNLEKAIKNLWQVNKKKHLERVQLLSRNSRLTRNIHRNYSAMRGSIDIILI